MISGEQTFLKKLTKTDEDQSLNSNAIHKRIYQRIRKQTLYLNQNTMDMARIQRLHHTELSIKETTDNDDYDEDEPPFSLRDFVKNLKSSKYATKFDMSCLIGENSFQILSPFLTEGFKTFQSLTKLSLRIEAYAEMNTSLKCLGEALKRASHLKSLELSFCSCRDLEEIGVKDLARGLKRIISLKELDLDFENSTITDNILTQFAKAFKNLKNLETISLNFKSCQCISDNGLKSLSQGLKSLAKVKRINLNFSESSHITDNGLKYLSQALENLVLLKQLNLDLSDCTETCGGLQYLREALIKLTSLTFFTLDISELQKIEDYDLFFLKEGLKEKRNLRKIILRFTKCVEISNNGLQFFSETFRELHELKILILNFDSCSKISDKGVTYLAQSFKEHSKIEEITLRFDNCSEISGLSLIQFCEGIKHCDSLTKLKLHFPNCKITNDGLSALSEELKRLGKTLTRVFLYFSECLDLTDEGLLPLSEGLRALTAVKYLDIEFFRCPKMTDTGFQKMSKALNGLKWIQSLKLIFGNKNSTTRKNLVKVRLNSRSLPYSHPKELNLEDQQFMCQLSQALKGFSNLSTLDLNFNGLLITDDGLFELGQSLKRLEYLKRLSLTFTECNGIKQNGLCQFIVNLPKKWQNIDINVRIPSSEYPDGKIHDAILIFS